MLSHIDDYLFFAARWLTECEALPLKDKRRGGDLFSVMGKTIAERWKRLSSEQAQKYRAMAAQDMERYRQDMDEYHADVARKAGTERSELRLCTESYPVSFASIIQESESPALMSARATGNLVDPSLQFLIQQALGITAQPQHQPQHSTFVLPGVFKHQEQAVFAQQPPPQMTAVNPFFPNPVAVTGYVSATATNTSNAAVEPLLVDGFAFEPQQPTTSNTLNINSRSVEASTSAETAQVFNSYTEPLLQQAQSTPVQASGHPLSSGVELTPGTFPVPMSRTTAAHEALVANGPDQHLVGTASGGSNLHAATVLPALPLFPAAPEASSQDWMVLKQLILNQQEQQDNPSDAK